MSRLIIGDIIRHELDDKICDHDEAAIAMDTRAEAAITSKEMREWKRQARIQRGLSRAYVALKRLAP